MKTNFEKETEKMQNKTTKYISQMPATKYQAGSQREKILDTYSV